MVEKNEELIPGFESFFKKYLGEIMAIIGTGFFVYNVFNFSYRTSEGFSFEFDFGEKDIQGVAYYYNLETLLLIAIGAILIVSGFLVIKNKNHERKN